MTIDDQYTELMKTLKERKAEIGISNAEIGKAINDTRTGVIEKLKSENIQLKNFLRLCTGLKLKIKFIKYEQE